MKIAFSTTDCPGQDFESAAMLAGRCGYDAVELSSANALANTPDIIRRTYTDANVALSSIHVGSDISQLSQLLTLAIEIGCDFVRIAGDATFTSAGINRLLTCADIAAEGGIGILIDNQPVTGSALRLWNLLDRLNHPGIGCCWNTLTAALANDAPAVAIPMLNSRIRYLHLQDAKFKGTQTARCDIGQGDLPLQNTTNRMRGIGYDGCILVGLAQQPDPDPARFEQSLLAARAVLQQWQVLPAPVPG